MALPEADRLLASAARFLIDGQQEDAASVLLSCSLELWESGDTWYAGDEILSAVHVSLVGPRYAYEILRGDQHAITKSVRSAVAAVLPTGFYVKHFTIHAELVDIDPDWRTELLEIARGKGVHNQAVVGGPARVWRNLRFRSQSEVRIAEALDHRVVLFLPNSIARLGVGASRRNREADFLVCCEGKWGILEVDGEPFHPASRTVEDHARDREFKAHGIRVAEHFDATRCYNDPEGVVQEFLGILQNA